MKNKHEDRYFEVVMTENNGEVHRFSGNAVLFCIASFRENHEKDIIQAVVNCGLVGNLSISKLECMKRNLEETINQTPTGKKAKIMEETMGAEYKELYDEVLKKGGAH